MTGLIQKSGYIKPGSSRKQRFFKRGVRTMSKRRPSKDGVVRKREDGRREGRIVVGHKADDHKEQSQGWTMNIG